MNPANDQAITKLGEQLFLEQRDKRHRATDRTFVILMVLQWIAGIIVVCTVSPRTWIGDQSTVHIHLWFAVFFGAILSSLPIALAWLRPGRAETRHTIAVAQMLWSALLIHFSGGRTETHFHVFGSLAFLAFYRDSRVILTATLVVTLDHMLRGIVWPQSVFGTLIESPFRWVEHAAWVVFEDIFLVISCNRGVHALRNSCRKQAQLQLTNDHIEQLVEDRTAELREANVQLASEIQVRENLQARRAELGHILEESINEIFLIDPVTCQVIHANRGARTNLGYSLNELCELTMADFVPNLPNNACVELFQKLKVGSSDLLNLETLHSRKDGTEYAVDLHLQETDYAGESRILAMSVDVSGRKAIERERDNIQRELVEASHAAGMAQVATGILHNVGNVLNSINISANVIMESLNNSRVETLSKVNAVISEHATGLSTFLEKDPRGKHFPILLQEVTASLHDEQDSQCDELRSLIGNIEHIKDIVSMQQSLACISGAKESLNVVELLRDALRINDLALVRHGVDVSCDFEDVPAVTTERHKVLQILVNLIDNAKQAVSHSVRGDRQLRLTVATDEASIRIQVADNGIGIPQENLARIFSHGFTTKKSGHGFGLHSSALAAQELGGALSAQSDGSGRGAEFTLRLPLVSQSKPTPHTNVGW